MSTQPIALWLAEKLEDMPADGHWLTANNAAAELRRLHEVNADLLEALCKLAELYDAMGAPRGPCRIIADAVIAKATGEQ